MNSSQALSRIEKGAFPLPARLEMKPMTSTDRCSPLGAKYGVCFALSLLGMVAPALGATLNSVTIKTYQTSGVLETTAHSYSDGMGRKIQEVVEDGASDILTGTVYDNFNRAVKSIKPVPTAAAAHAFYPGNIVDLANAWYDGTASKGPAAGGAAYTETQYEDDPLGHLKSIGQPGSAFSLAGGHAFKKWHFGRASIGFIAAPTDALLDATTNEANAKYFLEVVKDANGNYAQSIKDISGNQLRSWANAGAASAGIIEAVNYPDYVGHVLKTLPAGEVNSADPTYSYYEMSATGQLLSSDTPDEGMIEMLYDQSGELRFIRNERDMQAPNSGKRFQTQKYDNLGRKSEVGILISTDENDFFSNSWSNIPDFPLIDPPAQYGYTYIYHPKIRNIYDLSSNITSDLNTPAYIIGALNNLKGKLAASVAWDESGDTQSPSHRVVEYFSYDRDGQVEKKFKIIPGLPVQRFTFTHDLRGMVKTKVYSSLDAAGSPTYTDSWNYLYDAQGRLSTIQSNGATLVTYDYNELGQLVGKHMKNGASTVADEVFTFNVRDWMLTHRSTNSSGGIYHETLTYDAPAGGTPQYNGNISSATHFYVSGGVTNSLFYSYDQAGQMVSTTGTAGYTESFAYDPKGRITQKTEGTRAYGPYQYIGGTHQVVSVPNSPMSSVLGVYVYDPNGNMILDRSKNMIVEYDWRNLPVAFKFFKSLPNRSITWEEVPNLKSTDGIVQSSEVQMMYDASGSRVWKKTFQF